jgi:cytochrome P450
MADPKTNPAPPEPVQDWATDYDIFDPGYVARPQEIWDSMRKECPVAHTERWGGSWMPTRMADIREIAHDTDMFTSYEVGVVPRPENELEVTEGVRFPPIDSDPPDHLWQRRLILPFFSPAAVERYEPATRALCRRLVEGFADKGEVDGAEQYAQQIPASVIAQMLGLPAEDTAQFTHWVREILEFGGQDPERGLAAQGELLPYLNMQIQRRRDDPGDDIISYLLNAEHDGKPIEMIHIIGTCQLLVVAGVDTTWSGIGSSLYHLATHKDDLARLVAEPELLPSAIEELLRAYSPVTMARLVAEDTEFQGCPMKAGDRVLMSWPAANRDPEAFEEPDKVIFDRERNRHLAFGLGIHRCAGSNLARMEMRVALEEFLRRIPEFELDTSKEMTWAGGQVRGPRKLPIVFPKQ